MTTTIDIDEDRTAFPIEDVLTDRGLLFGQSGSGKSNSASVVIEALLEHGHAMLVVDTDGEYYGLKEAYEVLHATGDDEGDITVGPEHADHLADLALEQNIPVILDVSAFLDPENAEELVGRVARALFAKEKKLRTPFLLVVEECHEYVPQRGTAGFAGDHITRIAKRGRKHGLGFLGISQRPANVDKDVVTQGNWHVWHRLKFKNDTSVVRDLYGSTIVDLANGEAFVDAEWADETRRVQWRRKRTFDAGATPGLDDTEQPELRSIDAGVIEDLRTAGDAARTQADRIEALEAQLAERNEQINTPEAEVERLDERNAWEEAMADRMLEGLAGNVDIEIGGDGSIRAEVLEIIEERQDLDERNEHLRDDLETARARVETLEREREQREAHINTLEQRIKREGDLHDLRDDLRELMCDRYPDVFDVESDERVDQLRTELQEARERVADLETRRPEAVDFEADLLSDDVVRTHIDTVAEECSYANTLGYDDRSLKPRGWGSRENQ